MTELPIYWTAFKASLLTKLEYRGDFVLSLLGGICFQLGPLLAYGVLRSHAPNLGDWRPEEMLFLFGLWAVCLGLSELFFNNIWNYSEQIIDGSLDRLLVYPVHSLPFYLVCAPSIHALANIAVGITMLTYAGFALDLGPSYWLLLPFWAACGTAIYTGLHIVAATVAMFAPGLGMNLHWLIAQVNWAARYPLHIYPALLRIGLLVLPPLGAYHYLPGLWLFHEGTLWQGLGAPLVAAVGTMAVANACWGAALNRYESTGS